jgi:truncated hemoglobin YjbI
MTEDLYELIGGRSTIQAATELFYRKLVEDENLRHFFKRVDNGTPPVAASCVDFHAARRTRPHRQKYS